MKKENEQHKFINRAWFTGIASSLALFIAGGIVSYIAGGFNLLYILGAMGLICCVMTPTNYVMDNRGIYVYYLFHFKMEYFWHKIWGVSKGANSSTKGAPFFGKHIKFYGSCYGPKFFDLSDVIITYNPRAKKLIEKYLHREIEDYTWSGDIKKLKKKIEQKKLKKQKQHHKTKRK